MSSCMHVRADAPSCYTMTTSEKAASQRGEMFLKWAGFNCWGSAASGKANHIIGCCKPAASNTLRLLPTRLGCPRCSTSVEMRCRVCRDNAVCLVNTLTLARSFVDYAGERNADSGSTPAISQAEEMHAQYVQDWQTHTKQHCHVWFGVCQESTRQHNIKRGQRDLSRVLEGW